MDPQIDRPLLPESHRLDDRWPRHCECVPRPLPQPECLAYRPVWSNARTIPAVNTAILILSASSAKLRASRRSDTSSLTAPVSPVFRRCAQSGRTGAPMRSFDNGTYALRKSRTSRLERRTYSATWLPCRDRVLNSSFGQIGGLARCARPATIRRATVAKPTRRSR